MDLNKPFSWNAPGHDQSPVVAVAIERARRGHRRVLAPTFRAGLYPLNRGRAPPAPCARVGGQRPVRALVLGGRVNLLSVESPRAREAAAGLAVVLFGCFFFAAVAGGRWRRGR